MAAPPQGALVDKIIANVGNQIILQSELEATYQQYLLQGVEEAPASKCDILEQMIVNKMLLSQVKQEKIVVDKEELERAFSDEMKSMLAQAGSEERLVQYWGKPMEAIKRELREKTEEQLMLVKMRTQLIKDITATPKEVKTYFESLPAQECPYYPTEVVVREIVQYTQVSQQEKDSLREQLSALKARLQNGEDFEVLAQSYSQDLGSAPQGGDIGFWRLGALDPSYEVAARALQPGEVSDPIATPLGFYLIQLLAQEEDRYNSRHILLKYGEDVLSIEAVKKQLIKLRADILAGKLTFAQAAIQRSEDPSTSSSGGLLRGEAGRGVRMLIDQVPSAIYFVVEQLAPGTISDPMLFTTDDGREAVRIILLEEKIAPHRANLTQDYDKIQQMLINKKRETALQDWLQRVQASTAISVSPEY